MHLLRSTFTVAVTVLILFPWSVFSAAIPPFREKGQGFAKAPEYRDGHECSVSSMKRKGLQSSTNLFNVHVAVTLDSKYPRESMQTVHSVLRHTYCPEEVFFHFIAGEADTWSPDTWSPSILAGLIGHAFPSLKFKIYPFKEGRVKNVISGVVGNPIHYARIYLSDILDPSVERVIYLESGVIVMDDVRELWNVPVTGHGVIGAPENCGANFTKGSPKVFDFNEYFPKVFDFTKYLPGMLSKVFTEKKPCYFSTGAMVMDLVGWREGKYTRRIERWMGLQKDKRIFEFGSLVPFLVVFGGDIDPIIDPWWNHHSPLWASRR